MFGIGTFELLVIVVIGLLILGPNKLPGLFRSIGSGIREFRRSLLEVDKEDGSEPKETESGDNGSGLS
jgi:TatA/E family protein of Tat protein translocase